MVTRPEPAELYPDIIAQGGLGAALRALADQAGLSVPISDSTGSTLGTLGAATVASVLPHRNALCVSSYTWKRWWSIRGTESFQDLELISGNVGDLTEIVRVAQAWHSGAPLDEIGRVASFVCLSGRFEVPDHDPLRLAESEWEHLRAEAREKARGEYGENTEFWPAYQALVEAAYAEPRLRGLYPFTSHWTLRFSATTRPRLTIVGPCIDASNISRYTVSARYLRDEVLAEVTTADAAISITVSQLPDNLGPVAAG